MFEDLEPFLRDFARRELTLASGETAFFQGDPVRYVFFVIAGAVELVRHQASGSPLVIQRAGPGAILAEASLESTRYHCTAVAVAKSALWVVSKKEFLRCMADNPNLSLAFVRRLAHELQNARFQAEILSMKTVTARLDGSRGEGPSRQREKGLALQQNLASAQRRCIEK